MGRLTSSVDLVTGLQTKPVQAKTPVKPRNDLVGTPVSDLIKAVDICVKVVHVKKIVHKVVHNDGSSRHGVYADKEKRKEYRREWMRAKRATRQPTGRDSLN